VAGQQDFGGRNAHHPGAFVGPNPVFAADADYFRSILLVASSLCAFRQLLGAQEHMGGVKAALVF